jgi:hypothetical protein
MTWTLHATGHKDLDLTAGLTDEKVVDEVLVEIREALETLKANGHQVYNATVNGKNVLETPTK